jgi:hypothetical protein
MRHSFLMRNWIGRRLRARELTSLYLLIKELVFKNGGVANDDAGSDKIVELCQGRICPTFEREHGYCRKRNIGATM